MKRRMVVEQAAERQVRTRRYIPINVPDDLKAYADELRLLKGVPLTYLLTEASDLPEESIRFSIWISTGRTRCLTAHFHWEVVREGCPVGQGNVKEGG